MTDRGLPLSDGATACPFVAFDDDRDERSDRPDHRHRCYAEIPPAPRAIAHQEAYCLTSAFAVCPTFQDWAQREAARTRRVAQAKADAAAAAAAAGADPDAANAAAASGTSPARRPPEDDESRVQPADEWRGRRPIEEDDAPLLPPRRNPPRDWAAPPPWAAGAGGGAGPGSVGGARGGRGGDPDAPQILADRAEGRGLAGSAADRLAAGEPVSPPAPEPGQRPPPLQQARPARVVHGPDRIRHDEDAEELASLVRPRQRERGPEPDDDGTSRYRTEHSGRDRGAIPGVNGEGRRRSAGPRAADDAPSWEEPRRYEAYPTIKTRSAMPGLPRLGIMVAALALAALVLFVGPGLLGLFGDDGDGGGALDASPSPMIAAETSSPEPTVAPAPTQQVYVIKSGDTLSKFATRFNVTLDELLEANKDKIKDPDRIAIGDEIIIPPPSELEE
jgi:hypothetical protein